MPGTNLTRVEASERADLVHVHSYDVHLDVTVDESTFATSTRVRFDASTPGADTFLDFVGAGVERLEVNGVALDPAEHYDGARVRIPSVTATNDVLVVATGRFTNTGEGLHRFVDPVDGESYLYTQFEVADCRRMFAVFEQPDLKATFTFTVTAPAAWEVVSTQPTPRPQPAGERVLPGHDSSSAVATWAFEATPVLSCYVTSLIAGPYAVVRDELTTGDGRVVPLGVFCRRSLLDFLDADEVFDITRRGFAFFEKEFGLAYPFAKYDQLFTPEFNAGAMENVGAVTYNEIYVFRAKVTESLVERRALTILHELAHMWFGNLVTMRWWDDLWLNESFAEWASTTCQAEATRWESAWTTFAIAEKAWAYSQDQLSSTHPIVAPIRDLRDVEVNFDGITYAKGASVLKQLVAYVGREPFVAGLRRYFAAHAYGNTTLADLMLELETTSGRDLRPWSAAWLETAGVATLRARYETAPDGTFASVVVEQTSDAAYPSLRPHRLAIGCYTLTGDGPDARFERTRRVEIDIDGAASDVPELIGLDVPDLLLVNDDDLSYAKIRLDERSLAAVLAHPLGFTDSLPQALVLGALWDMTRDAEMRARDFVGVVLTTLSSVQDSTMLRVLLGQLRTAATLYVAPDARADVLADVTARMFELACAAEPGGDAQLQLVSAYAQYARTSTDLEPVRRALAGEAVFDSLAVDTEMRWTLLTSLVAGGAAGEADIVAEEERDATATGRERAAKARAAAPTAEAKAHAWRIAVEQDGLANQTLDAVAAGFNRVHDTELLRPYVGAYHDAVLDVARTRSHAISESVIEGFYPLAVADDSLRAASQAWLDDHLDAPAAIRRLVSERRDGIVRALAAQERDGRD